MICLSTLVNEIEGNQYKYVKTGTGYCPLRRDLNTLDPVMRISPWGLSSVVRKSTDLNSRCDDGYATLMSFDVL